MTTGGDYWVTGDSASITAGLRETTGAVVHALKAHLRPADRRPATGTCQFSLTILGSQATPPAPTHNSRQRPEPVPKRNRLAPNVILHMIWSDVYDAPLYECRSSDSRSG